MLPTIWFVLIAVLWFGYLLLEGFDLGVGMHMRLLARDEHERRVLLNTIGPVWDGNEVWLLTAGGAMFAAFPMWYASLFSALYLPLLVVLVGLIMRATAIEYRGKVHSDRWRDAWTWAIAIGSLLAAFGVGAALALTTLGLPINANGDREGSMFAWFTLPAIVGGLAAVGFALAHSLLFIALKTDGEIRHRARGWFTRMAPVALLPLVIWVLWVQIENDTIWTWAMVVLAVVAVAVAFWLNLQGRELPAFVTFALFVAAGLISIFGAVYPVVLPSTLDPAWSLTVDTASSSDYTLKVMTFVALFGVPLVLLYQGWSYYVFRNRISSAHIPAPHEFGPAIEV